MSEENLKQQYEHLTFTDPFLFAKVMQENPDICIAVASLVTGRKVKSIATKGKGISSPGTPEVEKTIKETPDGKGIRLDVFFEDDESIAYDLEMQTVNKDSLSKRFRYYQSMLDQTLLEAGRPYKELKRSYIVFICTFDPFNAGLTRYEFISTCKEDQNIIMDDESSRIVINTAGTRNSSNSELNSFLDYLEGNKPSDDLSLKIQEAVIDALRNAEWRLEYMFYEQHLMEAKEEAEKVGMQQGLEKGIAQGLEQGRLLELFDLVNDNLLPVSEAAKRSNLPEDQFQEKLIEYNTQA